MVPLLSLLVETSGFVSLDDEMAVALEDSSMVVVVVGDGPGILV